MDIQEVKKQLEAKSDELLQTLKKANDEIKLIGGEHKETANEVETLKEQISDLNEKQAELTKINDRIDELETSMKSKIIKGNSESDFKKFLSGDDFKNWKSNRGTPVELKMNGVTMDRLLQASPDRVKADLDSGTNFANQVFPPQVLPGIRYQPPRSVRARDLMPVGSTSSNVIWFLQETSYTDNAGAVAEGGTKGQSEFVITQQSAAVRRVATYIRLTEEMLDDTAFLESYLRTQLTNKIKKEEDDQLILGSGVAPNIDGLVTQATAYSDVLEDANVNRYDVLLAAMTQAKIDNYRPTAIIVHPNDALKIKTTKDSQGQYLWPAHVREGAGIMVDGAPLIEHTAITETEFLVGDFANGCQLFDREQVSVRFYEQDGSNVITGKVTVLAEERIALVVNHTGAFITGDFATALAEGTS